VSDRVSVGVTHQVRIGREDAWIKLEVVTDVTINEDTEDAVDRANEIVQRKIFEVITSTVEAVKAFEEQ
jgi:hypothetical protein